MTKKIVLTGGHAATTALAVVQEIKRKNLDWEIYWIGTKHAMEGKKVATLESAIFPEVGVKVFNITSGRLQLRFSRYTLPALFKIPVGFLQSFKLLSKIRPDIILSFGGSASVPVVVTGWLLRIPIVVHEQVATAGRANELASKFAKRIILSRESSLKFYPEEKSVVLGNPIVDSVKKVKPKTKPANPKAILITGGSRGSQTLNKLIEPILSKLLLEFKIIHLTGEIEYAKFFEIKNELNNEIRGRYLAFPNVKPNELLNYYSQSDLIIARAGANTVSEIMYVKRPAVLVPISWSYRNEQYKNALFAKDFGIAEILNEDLATPDDLYDLIQKLSENWQTIINKVIKKETSDLQASSRIVDLLEGMV